MRRFTYEVLSENTIWTCYGDWLKTDSLAIVCLSGDCKVTEFAGP